MDQRGDEADANTEREQTGEPQRQSDDGRRRQRPAEQQKNESAARIRPWVQRDETENAAANSREQQVARVENAKHGKRSIMGLPPRAAASVGLRRRAARRFIASRVPTLRLTPRDRRVIQPRL